MDTLKDSTGVLQGESYDMNANISNPTNFSGFSGHILATQVQFPSDTYLLLESGGHSQDDRAMGWGANTATNRHRGGAHSLYCDGHVNWGKAGPTSSPPSRTLNYDIANARGWGPSAIALTGGSGKAWTPPTVPTQ